MFKWEAVNRGLKKENLAKITLKEKCKTIILSFCEFGL